MAEENGSARRGKRAAASPLTELADDVLLQILDRLEGDPRDWARASCASPRLAALLGSACLPPRLTRTLPADLLPAQPPKGAPAAWAALQKLSVCCPGLLCAGVLLEPADDLGLELDIGPDVHLGHLSVEGLEAMTTSREIPAGPDATAPPPTAVAAIREEEEATTTGAVAQGGAVHGTRRRRWVGPTGAHLSSGSRTLSREQGNKLLASRFRGDRLYLCDWPGCVHAEQRRKYMVFRGVFLDFARSQVRRALRDTRRPTVAVECAYCGCKEAWDLYSAFCLRSFYGYHDDGDPVVRAYVCRKGHVAGAWTERPLYS